MKFIIDLDGTLLDNDQPNLDSVDFMTELVKRNLDFLIMTNSVCPLEIIVDRLLKVGITVPIESVINPIVSINSYLRRQGIDNAFIVGSQEEISQVSVKHEVVFPSVILFLDFEKSNVDYKCLQKIFRFIQKGVPIIAASGSTYYSKGEYKTIDTGSFVVMFESLLGDKIPVFGKPNENYFNEALSLLACGADKVTVIGDDWKTDIQGAKKVGCRTVLLKSGKYKEKDEESGLPDMVANNLMEVFEKMVKKEF